MKYQIKWKSGYYKNEGCSKPPFKFDNIKEEFRNDDSGKTDLFFKADLEGNSWEEIFHIIHTYFPDCEIISHKLVKSSQIINGLRKVCNIILLLLWIVFSVLAGICYGIYIGVVEGCKKIWGLFLTGLNVLIIKEMKKDNNGND